MTVYQPDALRGQRALVTGGSSGIGAAVCRALAAAGARVVVNYLSNREEAERYKRRKDVASSKSKAPLDDGLRGWPDSGRLGKRKLDERARCSIAKGRRKSHLGKQRDRLQERMRLASKRNTA